MDEDFVVLDCPLRLVFGCHRCPRHHPPEMRDVMSMSQFLPMTSDPMDVIARTGADMGHDWLCYLLTRHDPTDAPQNRIVAFLRTLCGDKVLAAPMVKFSAILDAGLAKQEIAMAATALS